MNENVTSNHTNDDEIDLFELWQSLLNEKFWILFFTLVSIIFGVLFAYSKTPIYSAAASVQVQQIQYPFSEKAAAGHYISIEGEATTANLISNTSGVTVATPVAGMLGLTKEGADPKALRLDVERAYHQIKSRHEQIFNALKPLGVKEVMPTMLVGEISVSNDPVKPKKTLIIVVSGVLGLMLGLFVALIRQAVKKRRGTNVA